MRTAFALAFTTLALSACDTNTESATPATVAGTYTATTFKVNTGTETLDVLAAGGTTTLVFSPTGTFTGTLNLPASLLDSDEFVPEAFSGTYTLSGNTLALSTSADLFYRDVAWTYADGTIRTSNPSRYNVVLKRR